MGFFEKMKSKGSSLVGNHHKGRGKAGGFVVDKLERYGASAAFGFLKGYYHEKFTWKGQGADLWIGGGLLAAQAILNLRSHGTSALAMHVERVADAGISSYLNSVAVGWGMAKSGRDVMVLNEGKVVGPKKVGGKKTDVVGMIPAAMGGSYLTADELAHYAAKR